MPLVSVVIPFYNRIDFVYEAIQSVLAQTFTDFEIVLVDDGSEEQLGTPPEKLDKRITYVRQANAGPAAARNLGILKSKGKYIAFLDSDDVFMSLKLETQVNVMEKNPNIMLSHTSYFLMNEVKEKLNEVQSGNFTGYVYPDILYCCTIATPTVMVRREALSRLKFEESVRIGEDIILWSQVAKESEILGINQCLTGVRIHKNNAAFNPEDQLKGNLNILHFALKYDSQLPFTFKYKKLSSTYIAVGFIYMENSRKIWGLKYFIKGLVTWPLSFLKVYKLIILMVIPKNLIPPLLKIWQRLKNLF